MHKSLAVTIVLIAGLQAGCSTIRGMSVPSQLSRPHAIAGVPVSDAGSKMLVRKVHLDAPPETVFDYLVDFESMPDWMPGLHEVTVDHRQSQNGPQSCGVGTVRTCSAKGIEVHERVVQYNRPYSFAVELSEASGMAPLSKGTGVVEIAPAPDGGSDVTYNVVFETKALHPMGLVAPTMFSKQLSGGMDNLVARFGGQRMK